MLRHVGGGANGLAAGCANTTAATVPDLTYGDVWFCSGQSNMELPMAHALTRSRTYMAVGQLGMYRNARAFKHGEHTARFDGDEYWILPPPPPPAAAPREGPGAPTTYYGWQPEVNSSTIDEFSAACWFFAQELTDIVGRCRHRSRAGRHRRADRADRQAAEIVG